MPNPTKLFWDPHFDTWDSNVTQRRLPVEEIADLVYAGQSATISLGETQSPGVRRYTITLEVESDVAEVWETQKGQTRH